MKKIGIITYHCADNFGAVLQAYSLQEILNKWGNNTEIIDFRPIRITNNYMILLNIHYSLKHYGFKRTVRELIKRLINIRTNMQRKNSFKCFRDKYLKLSKEKYFTSIELKQKKPYYDIYITGSDQVWNPKFFTKIGESYFLDFAHTTSVKVSYAASISIDLNNEYNSFLKKNLERFEYISVRERSAKEALEKLTDKKIFVALDPTLLLSKEDWDSIATADFSKRLKGKFMLVYDLVNDPVIIKIANSIAEINGLRIVSYSGNKKFINHEFSFSNLNPTEFLGLCKKAECVVTNSYHGTLFSIIFRKKFYTMPHPTRGSRMIDLLNELGLNNNLITSYEEFEKHPDINYCEHTNERLEKMRLESLYFLKNAISSKE